MRGSPQSVACRSLCGQRQTWIPHLGACGRRRESSKSPGAGAHRPPLTWRKSSRRGLHAVCDGPAPAGSLGATQGTSVQGNGRPAAGAGLQEAPRRRRLRRNRTRAGKLPAQSCGPPGSRPGTARPPAQRHRAASGKTSRPRQSTHLLPQPLPPPLARRGAGPQTFPRPAACGAAAGADAPCAPREAAPPPSRAIGRRGQLCGPPLARGRGLGRGAPVT